MRFCDNLKNIRKQKKISQEDLAEKIGVSRQSVSKWECGEAYPTMDNIMRLCKLFNCKINNLVHDDLTDIDSLDEEIKMSVVKLKDDQQRKMKGLSKAIYIIARICKVVSIIGIVSVIISMVAIGIVTSNTKIEDNTITIFDEKLTYTRSADLIEIEYNDDKEEITKKEDLIILNKILDYIENKSTVVYISFIEFAFLTLIVSLILLVYILKHLETLFVNIHNGETPFTKENIDHIKKMAYLMIAAIVLPNICGLISEVVIQEDLNIGFELMDVIYVLFLFSMAYIFEYGYELQLDSKGKMYSTEK